MQSTLAQRVFPIKTQTACQLKWTWSTVYLTTGKTASCHRTNHHRFDTENFNFHNTPEKIQDRQRMLHGLWPEKGCDYCREIEMAGGQSDRITNLDMPGIHAPVELEHNPLAVRVTPRILEIYLNNTCNLKCVYCGSHFSSLWEAENRHHGRFESNGLIIKSNFEKDKDFESNKEKLFAWLIDNAQHLTNLNVLGGEPLFQPEFEQVLDLLCRHPAPDLSLQIFSNLAIKKNRLQSLLHKIQTMVDKNIIRSFTVTASLDCWGPRQEYARFPLNLQDWEDNFNFLLGQKWLDLVIGSTITPVTITTMADLIQKINSWNDVRPVAHYFNSVNNPSYMFIDILGDIFLPAFQRAVDAMSDPTPDHRHLRGYLEGIMQQSASKGVNTDEALKLRTFLNEMDRRRGTNWKNTFPELIKPLENLG